MHDERSTLNLDDVRIERLLERFFAVEVPAEFRPGISQPQRVSHRAPPAEQAPPSRERIHRSRSHLPGGIASNSGRREPALLAVAVAAVLMFGVIALQDDSAGRRHSAPAGLARAQPASVDRPLSVPPALEETTVVERYETPSGRVEQRTNLRWSNVDVVEPESGEQIELLLPELSIEIFEIDGPRTPAPRKEAAP